MAERCVTAEDLAVLAKAGFEMACPGCWRAPEIPAGGCTRVSVDVFHYFDEELGERWDAALHVRDDDCIGGGAFHVPAVSVSAASLRGSLEKLRNEWEMAKAAADGRMAKMAEAVL